MSRIEEGDPPSRLANEAEAHVVTLDDLLAAWAAVKRGDGPFDWSALEKVREYANRRSAPGSGALRHETHEDQMTGGEGLDLRFGDLLELLAQLRGDPALDSGL